MAMTILKRSGDSVFVTLAARVVARDPDLVIERPGPSRGKEMPCHLWSRYWHNSVARWISNILMLVWYSLKDLVKKEKIGFLLGIWPMVLKSQL